jgi:Chaperone for flagella basal body P-ring formation
MRNYRRTPIIIALLTLAMLGFGANPACTGAAAASKNQPLNVPPPPTGKLIRAVEDAELDTRWLLLGDPQHPGTPPRMVEATGPVLANSHDRLTRKQDPAARKVVPAISRGEEIVLMSANPASRVALHGMALSTGQSGDEITARLDVFQTEVHALVLAPGRAEILSLSKTSGWQR